MRNIDHIVHVVHCIDTEGPLYEPIEATFARVEEIFGLKLEPSRKTLQALQNREIDLGGREEDVARVLAPHLLNYNDTWDKVDAMISEAVSDGFRGRFRDSFGNPWRYNWFCLDHVEFDYNPRRRDMGYHNIHDHYKELFREVGNDTDSFYFHHHATPFNRHANYCASNFLSFNATIFKILARRIIDRAFFPSCYRPGCQTLRPDMHWFLEQFVPFDYSSLAYEERGGNAQIDAIDGRFEDWRKTRVSWEPYHPHHDDYQREGGCRRYIARCLNIRNRLMSLDIDELELGFREASEGKPVIVSFSDHDFRDILPDVEEFHVMSQQLLEMYPNVKVKYCDAAEAMRLAMEIEPRRPCRLDLKLEEYGGDGRKLRIRSDAPVFGPQPFFALKTKSGQYFHDNLDFEESFREWTYVFDTMTFPLDAIECIGVATNDSYGNTTVVRMYPGSGAVEQTHLNAAGQS